MFSLPAIILRDHLVLCDADRLQVLNPTARRLWEIHQETQDAERTVAWLAETYGLTVEQAERDIAALFSPDPHADPGAGEPPPPPALPAAPPYPRRGKSPAASVGRSARGWESHYRIFDRPFSLRCATPDLARAIPYGCVRPGGMP